MSCESEKSAKFAKKNKAKRGMSNSPNVLNDPLFPIGQSPRQREPLWKPRRPITIPSTVI